MDRTPTRKPLIFLAALGAFVVAGLVRPREVEAQQPPVTTRQIEQAIDRARDWLVRQQKGDGSWECSMRPNETRVGATSLVTLALLNAGVPPENPAVAKALQWLRSQTPDETYSVSLQTMVLAIVTPDADRLQLARNVKWLEDGQIRVGATAGSWSYHHNRGNGDNSNSQYAMLALHEASEAGVRVTPAVWELAQKYWISCQVGDGSWGYTLGNLGGSGSMTCAGITSLWITSQHLMAADARAAGESVTCCGGGRSPQQLERGLAWLGSRFTVVENPGTRGQTWLYYYLYGLERVGRFTARRYIGNSDWYLEGAKMFVASQDQLDGTFKGSHEDKVVATSFALLFLAKGRRPVIVAKSRHTPDPDWNRHGHEVAHLVRHVEKRWKRDYPAGLSWHVVDTPTAGLDDLLQAPVLWLSGSQGLDLGPGAGQKLRAYLDDGGFIFAEACCPQSDRFDADLRRLMEEAFPEPEFRFQLLPPEHPAWNAEEIVPANLQRPLLGIDYGCRTSVIYAPPTDNLPTGAMPSLGCLWELGGSSKDLLQDNILREVDAALAIGTNVLAYATNRQLKSKDELFVLPEKPVDPAADPAARGRLAIGKLRHAGMCNAAPAALANVLRAAARELGATIDDAPRLIDPTDEAIFGYHMLFMHGRSGFAFEEAGRKNVATFLDRGGLLIADSICGSGEFSDAFRAEIDAILPASTLEEIPADDPLFTAAYGGFDIRRVTLRQPLAGNGRLDAREQVITPKLEGIRMGDRWAVIFSPYDLSCALEKQNSLQCTGYTSEDAQRIALNLLLYSLNH
jgi:hypothetical protein